MTAHNEPAPRLWPLADLLAATGLAAHEVAVAVKASGTTMARAATEGLTDHQADTWATRCHTVAAYVWPAWADPDLVELVAPEEAAA